MATTPGRQPRPTIALTGGPCDGRTAELDDPRDAIRVIYAVLIDDAVHVLNARALDTVKGDDWRRWEAYRRRDSEPMTYDHTPDLNPARLP